MDHLLPKMNCIELRRRIKIFILVTVCIMDEIANCSKFNIYKCINNRENNEYFLVLNCVKSICQEYLSELNVRTSNNLLKNLVILQIVRFYTKKIK